MASLEQIIPPVRAIGVLTVDAHPLYRRGLHQLLSAAPDIEPVGEVDCVERALDWLRNHHADVVLLEHELPGTAGVEALPHLREHHTTLRVIMLTVCEDENVLMRAIRAGADGYLLKDCAPESILDAIRATVLGECRVSERMVRSLFQGLRPRDLELCAKCPTWESINGISTGATVTGRERQVLTLLAQGLSNKAIARELAISPHTVRNQLQRLQMRCNARNRVQLALYARQRGFG